MQKIFVPVVLQVVTSNTQFGIPFVLKTSEAFMLDIFHNEKKMIRSNTIK